MKPMIRVLSASAIGITLVIACLWFLNAGQTSYVFSAPLFSAAQSLGPKTVVVDDFMDFELPRNSMGGESGCWGASDCTVSFENENDDYYLKFDYNIVTASTTAGYYAEFSDLDVSTFDTVWVALNGEDGTEPVYVELEDCNGQRANHAVSEYLHHTIDTYDWTGVAIPVVDFEGIDHSCVNQLNIFVLSGGSGISGIFNIDEILLLPKKVFVDDFGDLPRENEIGGNSGKWESPTETLDLLNYKYLEGALRLDYDVTLTSPSAAVYLSELRHTNLLQQKNALLFKIRGNEGSERVAVELIDCGLNHTPKVKISDYLDNGITPDWNTVNIPLAAFADGINWACIQQLNFLVNPEPWLNSMTGTIFIDDIELSNVSPPIPLVVDHFNDCDNYNAFVKTWYTGTYGTPVEVDAGYDSNDAHRRGDDGCGYRFTYEIEDGTAVWLVSPFSRTNVSDYSYLRFWMKGARGHEELNIYMTDQTVTDTAVLTEAQNTWQEVIIDLRSSFPVIDLTDIKELKFIVESEKADGEVYLDDIYFFKLQSNPNPIIYLPIIFKDYRPPDSKPSCEDRYNNYEPNNYMWSTTTRLDPGTFIESYICASDDRSDYYYIDVTNPDHDVEITLSSIPSGVDYDLYLYLDETVVGRSRLFGHISESITYEPAQAGRYYIRVYPYEGYSLNSYRLQADYQ